MIKELTIDTNEKNELYNNNANKHEKIIKYLVKHGVDVNKHNNKEWTPIYEACENDHVVIIYIGIGLNYIIFMYNKYICNELNMIYNPIYMNENHLNEKCLIYTRLLSY
ncbi:hypothetical protein PIROE2DRAFT_5449 [Piromyces sp. E2]|nr:hypothetical protein PIROE2DRAFT_5449 [Piromyces sp. E2]|eukprot:OUM67181.1 hypothetical protein PIROE2DRAFT_5449 [Piromyces sp. E2]